VRCFCVLPLNGLTTKRSHLAQKFFKPLQPIPVARWASNTLDNPRASHSCDMVCLAASPHARSSPSRQGSRSPSPGPPQRGLALHVAPDSLDLTHFGLTGAPCGGLPKRARRTWRRSSYADSGISSLESDVDMYTPLAS